jgi:hypothetical protein
MELWLNWEDLGLSLTNRSAIEAYPMRQRSFKTPAAIVLRLRFELEKVARYLEKNGYLTATEGKYNL